MRSIQLVHNPGAGDKRYDRNTLLELLEKEGFDCRYFSTKRKGWKEFSSHTDLVAVAGGDGTVRKVVKEILKRKLLDKTNRLAILPLGTANNIATTLKLGNDHEKLIASWRKGRIHPFDVGRVFNLPGHKFFLEGFGYGVFPRLIQEMKKFEVLDNLTPEESMNEALKLLHKIILTYEPRRCKVTVDGRTHEGDYILAEVMNTPLIGPNLRISPNSDPGDGRFEIVLVAERDREKFADFVAAQRHGHKRNRSFKMIKGTDITMQWDSEDVHLDDELVEWDAGQEVQIQLKSSVVAFLV